MTRERGVQCERIWKGISKLQRCGRSPFATNEPDDVRTINLFAELTIVRSCYLFLSCRQPAAAERSHASRCHWWRVARDSSASACSSYLLPALLPLAPRLRLEQQVEAGLTVHRVYVKQPYLL